MTTLAPSRRATAVSLAAVGALAVGAALVLLLQVIPPTDAISATRRTISEYGLSANKEIFNLAVVLVATGSAAGLAALAYQRRLPVVSAVLGALWTSGLLVIVAFPKHDWRVDPTLSAGGTAHRIASIMAFAALPLAVLCAAKRAFPHSPGRRRLARLLALASFGWLVAILTAVVIAVSTGRDWWLIIPYGLEERGMALTELLALASLLTPVREQAEPVPAPARVTV